MGQFGSRDSGFFTNSQTTVCCQCVTCCTINQCGVEVPDSGCCATVRCGANNCASGGYSAALGGRYNSASGCYSFVGGGYCNIASGSGVYGASIVVGGGCNIASGYLSSIVGGQNNLASGNSAFIGGGVSNISSSNNSFIGSGRSNTASNCYATISGGYCNTSSSFAATVSGGRLNTASGCYSFIGGGAKNLANSPNGFVGGGCYNNVCVNFVSVNKPSYGAIVVGGIGNNTCGGTWSSCYKCFTVLPTILNAGTGSFIGGGIQNRTASSYYASIVGGYCNSVSGGRLQFIGGGAFNTTSANYSTISGGCQNQTIGYADAIVGGEGNIVCGDGYAIVGGGYFNCAQSAFSSILGGRQNNINTGSNFASIAGGGFNCMSGVSGSSFIGGGGCNIVSSGCSSILGGLSNNTCTFVHSHIIGSNICATRACTTFVNDLSICSFNACSGCSVCIGANGVLVSTSNFGSLTLQQVTTNGNTSNVGISVTAGGVSTNSLTVTSLTTGSVPFVGTAGLITQDNPNFFWDDTNNRLGIGTTTPLGILHLFVSAATTRMLLDGNAGRSKIITYRTNGLQRFGLYVNNTAESGSNEGSDFQIRAYNDAGTLLTTPLFIKRSSGNFLINSTTDDTLNKLQVTGRAKVTGITRFESYAEFMSAPNTSAFIIARAVEIVGGGNDMVLYTQSGLTMQFWTNGVKAATISTAQNFLIGSAIDDTVNKLQVNGSALINGSLSTTAGNVINANGGTLSIIPNSVRGVINLGGTTDNFLTFANKAYIGVGSNYMQVLAQTGVALSLVSDASTVLSFALTTGAATFSSSVTANSLIIKNSGVPAAQLYRDLDVGVVGSAGQGIEFGARNGATFISGAAIYGGLEVGGTTGQLLFQTLSAGSLTTKMFISNIGNVLINSVVDNTVDKLQVIGSGYFDTKLKIASTRTNGILNIDVNLNTPTYGIDIKTVQSAAGGAFIQFTNLSDVACGSITHTTATTVAYNTSSDYRLKQDLKDFNGIDLINSIKVYDFEWKEDKKRMYGVIAHEIEDIIPYAVSGKKDGEKMQGFDYSFLTPILTKAIQEQQKTIESLLKRIEILENKNK
jgi:hypothetical protein